MIHIRLLDEDSGRQRGTLTHIKNLLKQSSLPKNPKDNMKAAEDFLLKVLSSYIVAAGKEILRSRAVDTVQELADEIVSMYTRVLSTPSRNDTSDGVFNYACELITLGMLWDHYHDAVREGDGNRVLLTWKFLLIVYKAADRTNYSKEAAILLAQHKYLFSERKACQLLYSRFVNTQGRRGCNVPCDLHNEHLNRRLKTVLRNLASNLQTGAILRAAKSIGVVNSVCEQFEVMTSKKKPATGHHATPSTKKDVRLVVNCLEEEPRVLSPLSNRSHASFDIKQSLLEKYDKDEVESWMIGMIGTHVLRTQSY